jgi:beta-glucosidase
MSGESSSRTDLDIPESQKRLLQALLKTGKPVVLVLFAGRPLTLTWENENVPAILNVWFGGTETGKAVADVLFGDVNPSGKLPATFPQNVGQLPIYYSQKNTGRPLAKDAWFQKFRSNYLDVSNEPLYPFGYGLSYTNFTYSNLKLDKNSITKADSLKISVNVRNNGNYDGEEVIQLYLQDLVGSQTRPIKELKGFQKVFIEKGKSKNIVFTISEEDLKFYNQQLEFISEPGKFKVFIGTNSRDVQEAEFDLID